MFECKGMPLQYKIDKMRIAELDVSLQRLIYQRKNV